MLRVHYTILKEERFGKATPMTKGGSLFEYPPLSVFSLLTSAFTHLPSHFCLAAKHL
jgi:hypothetical protein